MFTSALTPVELVTEGLDSKELYQSKIKLVEMGYSPRIIPGTLRGQKNVKTGSIVYVYDIEYVDRKGVMETIRRTESFGM